jgi:hypothetical protein
MDILLLELMVRKLVIGNEFPELLTPFEASSSIASLHFEAEASAASISHIKTSPPRPPEATILLY